MTAAETVPEGDDASRQVRVEAETALLSFLGESPDGAADHVQPWLAAMRSWREREAVASVAAGC